MTVSKLDEFYLVNTCVFVNVLMQQHKFDVGH